MTIPVVLEGDPPPPGPQKHFLPRMASKTPVKTGKQFEKQTDEPYDPEAELGPCTFQLEFDEEGSFNHWSKSPAIIGDPFDPETCFRFYGPVVLTCWYEEPETGVRYHEDIIPEMVANLPERLKAHSGRQQEFFRSMKKRGFEMIGL